MDNSSDKVTAKMIAMIHTGEIKPISQTPDQLVAIVISDVLKKHGMEMTSEELLLFFSIDVKWTEGGVL